MALKDIPPPKVSKELEHAAEDDWKRSVRDAAKHRAVAQMENYDGFKNMVSVAHLRPWHAENLKDHSGPPPPAFAFAADGKYAGPSRNPGSGRGVPGSLGKPLEANGETVVPPANSMQFDKTWRRARAHSAARWRYVGAMRDEDIDTVFAVDITGATLGEIAEALAEGFERVVAEAGRAGGAREKRASDGAHEKEASRAWRGVAESEPHAVAKAVVGTLDRVRRAGRFDLARRLMSGKAKKALASLFDALGGCVSGDTQRETEDAAATSVEALREAFGVVASDARGS